MLEALLQTRCRFSIEPVPREEIAASQIFQQLLHTHAECRCQLFSSACRYPCRPADVLDKCA